MTWLMRAGFLVLIVLTLGWKLDAATTPGPTDDAADLRQLLGPRLNGPLISRPWGGQATKSLIFSAPVAGCASPLIITSVSPSTTTAEALEGLERPGDHHLFAYLGWTSDEPDRWTLLRLRLQDKVARAAGLSPYADRYTMLFVDEAPGCAVAAAVPWREFWTRG